MAVVTSPASSRSLVTQTQPRLVESVVGRMLELLVASVEGIRDRVSQRATLH